MKYQATFTPQAWINDYAVVVDAAGPTVWDCTEYMKGLPPRRRQQAMEADSYESDDVQTGANTPQWIRDWSGPFYITVEEIA